MTRLSQYLANVSQRPWQYGRMDCCTFMADWLMLIGYSDAMADRRGTYSSKREYRAAIRSEGGIVASCATRFSKIGLSAVDNPIAGDVALVLAPFAAKRSGRVVMAPVGAICTREGWFTVISPDMGIIDYRPQVVAAWKANNG